MAESTEKNKALVNRYIEEVWNNGKLDLVDELFSPEYELTDSGKSAGTGPDSIRQFASALRKAVPDLHYTVMSTISEGDTVVVRLASAGSSKHASERSKHRQPPKGVLGFTVKNGKIVSGWQHWDYQPSAEKLPL